MSASNTPSTAPVKHEPMDPFPVLPAYGNPRDTRSGSIPWWLAEQVYARYAARYGEDQSLETIAHRGGFALGEIVSLLGGGDGS